MTEKSLKNFAENREESYTKANFRGKNNQERKGEEDNEQKKQQCIQKHGNYHHNDSESGRNSR